MNPSQGNLLDIHQVLGPLLMKYWIDRLESEATDFESIGNTHNSSHYRAVCGRIF